MVESATTRVIIDTSSDFRQQMLQHRVAWIDAIIFTHHHFDHIGGFDDIRGFNFTMERAIPIYLMQETFDNLRRTFLYAFEDLGQRGGGVPVVEVHIIDTEPFTVGDITFLPIPMMHGTMRVNGYRIGDFAYCTDTNFIPNSSRKLIENLKILILDALRYHPHPTHFTVEQAVQTAQELAPRETYFTHIAHNILHAELEKNLPAGVFLSVDGMSFEC
jgi:phosphoribosyl 1,2-cyclic phosphate phosphodiesterase